MDWNFGQFYPSSCTECNEFDQQAAIIEWRLYNDSTIREAFYETDGDATNRFFMMQSPLLFQSLNQVGRS